MTCTCHRENDCNPIKDLVIELQRGDIPAAFENTGGGVMCCTLAIETPGGELWQWICGLANDPEWGFDVIEIGDGAWTGDSILDIPWQIRQMGSERGHPNPTTEASTREVATWLMTAITDMHGERPAFVR
jgi:hypothetical protein